MSWPEKETFDQMMKRFARKCLAERKDKPPIIVVDPVEQMDRPKLRRRIPPQNQRFPTDEELDRMWGKL